MGIDHFEWKQMMAEELYHLLKVGDSSWERMQEAQWKFNHSRFWEDEEALTDLRKCLGQAPGDLILMPPVCFDHGDRIVFGKNCYANTGLTILDEHWVRIGDHVLMGPHVSIYTANHPLDPVVRREGLETAHPVTIEDDVWIGDVLSSIQECGLELDPLLVPDRLSQRIFLVVSWQQETHVRLFEN